MTESDEQAEERAVQIEGMVAELKARGFAEEISAAALVFRRKFDQIFQRQQVQHVPLDQGVAEVREAIAEYHAALTQLMSQEPKAKVQEEKTPVKNSGQEKWNSDFVSIQRDLEELGGLQGVTIDLLSIRPYFRGGRTEKGAKFTMSWYPQRLLILSVSQYEKGLIDAFSAVLGYGPFCRYTSRESGLLTYEWDSQNPEERIAELKSDGEKDIERIRAN